MINVARLPESDRRELFRNTADKMGLNDTIRIICCDILPKNF